MGVRWLGWRRLNRRRVVAWIAVSASLLAMASGCSGSANPVNRLKARLQLKHGNVSYLAGEYGEAIRSYDAALRYVPELAAAHLNRAYSQEALARSSSGLAERQRLATAAVTSFGSYLDLIDQGRVVADEKTPGRERIEEHILSLLIDSQQIDEAVAHLQSRFEKNPRDASALEMLSRLEMDRGNLDAALEWQRKRMEAQPQDPDACYSLGAFVWLVSYRDAGMELARRMPLLDEGMSALQRALDLRPNDFETLIYVNLILLEKAKYVADDAQRGQFQAQAKMYRDRALALRKAVADTAATMPAAASGEPAAGMPGSDSPDSVGLGRETP
jgi:tetratricopeptide (TPR) repeat protein